MCDEKHIGDWRHLPLSLWLLLLWDTAAEALSHLLVSDERHWFLSTERIKKKKHKQYK